VFVVLEFVAEFPKPLENSSWLCLAKASGTIENSSSKLSSTSVESSGKRVRNASIKASLLSLSVVLLELILPSVSLIKAFSANVF
jgi:hypothetical protein